MRGYIAANIGVTDPTRFPARRGQVAPVAGYEG